MELTNFVLVNLGIIIVPLAISLYRETRFTDEWAMVGYGLAAVLFSALFYFDPNTNAAAYNELKAIAFWIFVPYGLLSVLVAWLYHKSNREEDQGTLPFSGKYFAAAQIPFIWAQYVAIPGTVWDTQTPGVIQWAVVCGIPIGIMHVFVYLVKNHKIRIHAIR